MSPRKPQVTSPLRNHDSSDRPKTRKLLLVASTGGHLAQLARFADSLGASPDSLWVTFETPQSESLLEGRRVFYVPYVESRDWRGALRATKLIARRLKRENDFEAAYSTGAALAVSALPIARFHGIPSRYIESVSRVSGPSMSGKILAATGQFQMFTQHPQWASKRWMPHRSVLAEYETETSVPVERPSLFVTLGTIKKYRFDSLIDAVLASGVADERTVWQVGETDGRTDLPGTVYKQVSATDFDKFARSADVVVSHAGVGSLLGLLELGIHPLLATRKRDRGEHVDDHQTQIAALANDLAIATAMDTSQITPEIIRSVSGKRVRPTQHGGASQ